MGVLVLVATGSKDWSIRAAGPADKPAILALINVIQPHIPWSSEHYDWQFLQGPAGPAEVRIIEADGRVVSLYVGTRKNLWVDGVVRRGIMVQDVLTHPEYRGRGFLNGMATAFLAEMRDWGDCGYTFPNKLSENSFRRSGWTELTPIPALQHSLDPRAEDKIATAEGRLTEVATFEPSVDAIWRSAGLRVGVLRDAAYLNWRYGRPQTAYRRFLIEQNRGYLVLKLYDRGDSKVMHVCDLVLRAEARHLCDAVLADARMLAASAGATLITAWLPAGHPYRPQFEAAGLVPDMTNDRFAFTTGPDVTLGTLAQRSHWHLSQADSDVY
jgi:GNAT superfamily N-acetyltransferase